MAYLIEAQKIRNFPPPPPPVIQGIITAPEKVDLPKTTKVSLDQTKSIAVLGENFLEDCVVAVIPYGENDLNAAKIIEHQLISSTEIRLDFTGSKEGTFDLLINTDKEITTRIEKAIEVKFSPWIDFRSGGNEVNKSDFKMTAGLDIKRDSQGLSFKGNRNNWKWGALYLPLLHSRQEKNTYEFIFYHTGGIHMVGVGREGFNVKSNSQIYQAEVVAYFSSSTHFNRFYGNGGNYYVGKNVTRKQYKKLILENNGEGGSKYYLYELPSGSKNDWDNTSTLKVSGKIGDVFKEEGESIAPFFIPYSLNNIKYTAVKLS